jgi:hypothetical protein
VVKGKNSRWVGRPGGFFSYVMVYLVDLLYPRTFSTDLITLICKKP